MARLLQAGLMCMICYIEVTIAAPIFQGIKVQRGFEIEFEPFTFKPISFFKEQSLLGMYGARRGIQRRDLSATILQGNQPPPPAPAPVHEVFEEARKQIKKDAPVFSELAPGPDPVNPALGNMIRVPVQDTYRPIDGFYTNIGRIPPVNSNLVERPPEVFFNGIHGGLPPRPVSPLMPGQAPVPLTVVPLITSPPPILANPGTSLAEIPPTEGPLVKGSRMALYLGKEFVKMISQFLANAKLQFSQMSSPPPPSPAPPPPPIPVMPLK